jgi:hypothetical protein
MSDQGEFDFGDDHEEEEEEEESDLQEEHAPYQAHSETSREAAELIEPSSSTLRGRVYAFVSECGEEKGATDDEMQVALRMNPSTQRPRRVELWRAGLVRDSGVKRPTRTGRRAVVWVVVRKKGPAPALVPVAAPDRPPAIRERTNTGAA